MKILALLKGLSWLSKFGGWFSLIPGFGPVASIASTVAGLAVTAVKAFFEGLTIAFAHPVVWLVVFTAFCGGLWSGIEWDRHKVEVRDAQIHRLAAEKAEAFADAQRRLATAHKARIAAEEASKAADDRESRAAADARRLRAALAKQKPADSGGPGLSGILSLSKSDGSPKPK